jgi:hypothetical protein
MKVYRWVEVVIRSFLILELDVASCQLYPSAALPQKIPEFTHLNMKLGGRQNHPGRFGAFLIFPRIEKRFLGRPVRSAVTIPCYPDSSLAAKGFHN